MTDEFKVYSFYKGNIPPAIVAGQKAVFAHLGIPLVQERHDDLHHGEWLDHTFAKSTDEIIVVADIDAFPLRRAAFDALVSSAGRGALCGLAQVANHRPQRRPYAGPMFMAVRRDVFARLGAGSLCPSPDYDAAQSLSEAARAGGVPLDLILPRFAMQPKWALGEQAIFGIGTFYGDLDFFHLFESRRRRSVELFEAVAQDCVADRLDFERYIEIISRPKWHFWRPKFT